MTVGHPLDRPVWSALTTRQRRLALGDGRALRFDPAFGPFAAAADRSAESGAALARMIREGEGVALVETAPAPAPEGLAVLSTAIVWQMSTRALAGSGGVGAQSEDLGEADAPQMRALAAATRPGPFEARTHELGAFVGVRAEGRLIAMAGERMRPDGHTEVSGVCVDPDWRGRGLAASLTRIVTERILARGETAFLHVFDTNRPAIAVYQALGFGLRREMTLTVLARTGGEGMAGPAFT